MTFATILLAVSLPVHAHTTSQIDTWLGEWQDTIPHGGLSVTDPHIDSLSDFIDRHQWYFHPPVRPLSRNLPGRGMGTNVEQWRGLVAAHFPADQIDRALCIMSYESGGNPQAKNPTSSARGLMQILASLWAPHFGVSYDALYDPETNIRLARRIYDSQGWWAWSPYKRGRCR